MLVIVSVLGESGKILIFLGIKNWPVFKNNLKS